MANFAYVENGEVQRVYDTLPEVWNNISNFFALQGEEAHLNSLGWYTVVKDLDFTYNPNTHTLLPPTFEFIDGKVYQRESAQETPATSPPPHSPPPMYLIRMRRNALMDAMKFRYERYDRRDRLGLSQIDDLAAMDKYMQDLADITDGVKEGDTLTTITWPTYPPQTSE